jgi:hypothetical protein
VITSIESKKKRADFRYFVPQDVYDAVSETVVICDQALIPQLIDLSPLERRVRLVIEKWKKLYKADLRLRVRGNTKKLKDEVETIRAANRILKSLLGCLNLETEISNQFLNGIATGELEKIANWLSWWPTHQGRPQELALASCAKALSGIFKKYTGKENWSQVGEIMADAFPEANPPIKGDLRLWAMNLVSRHRQRLEKLKQLPEIPPEIVYRTNRFQSQPNPKKRRKRRS